MDAGAETRSATPEESQPDHHSGESAQILCGFGSVFPVRRLIAATEATPRHPMSLSIKALINIDYLRN
jgi:hypothetical protein